LFEDVVPYINTKYNTSGYNSIIGHSNTAHFVIYTISKNNPFNGISLSLSGESENLKRKNRALFNHKIKRQIFIGYGTKDL
jgi:predicted alpha/beta superfamily hydrolase